MNQDDERAENHIIKAVIEGGTVFWLCKRIIWQSEGPSLVEPIGLFFYAQEPNCFENRKNVDFYETSEKSPHIQIVQRLFKILHRLTPQH